MIATETSTYIFYFEPVSSGSHQTMSQIAKSTVWVFTFRCNGVVWGNVGCVSNMFVSVVILQQRNTTSKEAF
eukprot:1099012-Amphidinium_carterae.1